MSKQEEDAQFQKALDAMDAAANDEEFSAAMAMLPKPPQEFLDKLDENGNFIVKPANHPPSAVSPDDEAT